MTGPLDVVRTSRRYRSEDLASTFNRMSDVDITWCGWSSPTERRSLQIGGLEPLVATRFNSVWGSQGIWTGRKCKLESVAFLLTGQKAAYGALAVNPLRTSRNICGPRGCQLGHQTMSRGKCLVTSSKSSLIGSCYMRCGDNQD